MHEVGSINSSVCHARGLRSGELFKNSSNLSFTDNISLKREYALRSMSIVKGKNVMMCEVPDCDYKSDKNSNFKRHFETMHYLLDPPIECCAIRFSTKGEFRHHSKSVHHEGHRCRLCGKLFNRKALLERHMAIHTGSKPFQCSKCDYASANKANVTRHLSVHRPGEARIEIIFDGVHQSNQFGTEDSFSLSSSLMDSSSERLRGMCVSQTGMDSSFSSTRTSSPCSIITVDDKESCSIIEDLVNTGPAATSYPKKGRISHSIESILGHVCTKSSQSVQENYPSEPNTFASGPLPDEIRKSEVGAGQENWTKINEEPSTNWSHLSPQPMSLQNPSSATPTSLLPSSSAPVQQFPPSYMTVTRKHPESNSMTSYPYYSYSLNERTIVSYNGDEVTPRLRNNIEAVERQVVPIVTSLNQNSRLVPGFFSKSYYNKNRNEVGESFGIKSDLIHHVYARVGIEEGVDDAGRIDCYKDSQGKGRNDRNSREFTDSKKRVHEELFMNEGPPVPPQEFMNGNGTEMMITHAEVEHNNEEDHYIPKKLRLSKKFGSSSP